ncbi:helix-turn-helix domain-containing protein [Vagococcus hydrophili]|uniref:Helix-turn-helix transcriptional regulator n=1 Tax=Vagococcus hydrophili TaxID=2714947 RepID=A0A6G8AS03_9ENTE|nr:helix-turn-helix transcriptional regulator [Vagococcus hydrophili]QIL47844.1 helix-turn-helix transcriptional regulator [Vagococcus hydrophili]
MNFGKSIKKHRLKLNKSQKEIASELHITPQTLSKWETNKSQPSIEDLVALKELYNLSLDEILTE